MTRRLVLAVLGVAAIAGALLLWHHQSAPSVPAKPGSAAVVSTLAGRALPDPATLARGSIAGTIRDDKSVPIAGARVCALGSSSELADELVREPVCAVADAAGAYRLPNLYPARYVVSASARTFRPGVHGDRRRPRLVLAAGEQKSGIDITLRGGGVEITGTVADLTGGPIANARVRADGGWWGADHAIATTETDAAGKFSLWVSPGRASLGASADGYADGGQSGRAPGRFEILLTPESSLAGVVVDATTNRPVEGAEVSVGASEFDGGELTRSDAKGAFRVARLTPGRIVAIARTERGFGRTEGSVLVGLGEHVDGVIVKLFPAHRIAGRVVIAGTKQPCPEASVTLQPEDGAQWQALRLRDDGLHVAEGVLPNTYTPEIRCRGYRARDRYAPIVIAGDDPAELVWEVEAGATIRGRVLTKAGAPVAGANLWAKTIGGAPRARSTWGGDQSGPDGSYELPGLAAGSYRIDVQTVIGVPLGDGYQVDVADGATVTKDLQLDDGGTMTGVVVDARGKPLAGITVAARPLGGGGSGMRYGGEQKSDDAGSFTFESLRAGDYRITAQRGASDRLRRPGTTDDDKQGEKVTVEVGRVATARLVVETAAGSITGTVIDHDGKPVADAFVNAARESDAAGARSSLRDVRWSWDERPVITGTDGTFTLSELAPGTYTIRAYRKGGGDAVIEHVAIGAKAKLQIKPTGSIEGLAKRTGGVPDELEVTLGDPASGFWRSETFYKTAGRFALRDVPKGSYKLTVSGRGGQSQLDLALAEGQAKIGVVIELAALVTLTGRVVELGTDKPVSGIRMSAALLSGGFSNGGGGDDEQVTDESGRFQIENVPRGRIRISGFAKDYRDSAYHFLSAIRDTTTSSADLGDIPIARRRVKVGDPIGDLGVNFADQPDDTPPDKRQFKVSYIDPRGPAAKTELRVGDLIVSVDGVDITGANAAHAWPMMRAPPGTKITLGIERGAKITITLAAP